MFFAIIRIEYQFYTYYFWVSVRIFHWIADRGDHECAESKPTNIDLDLAIAIEPMPYSKLVVLCEKSMRMEGEIKESRPDLL